MHYLNTGNMKCITTLLLLGWLVSSVSAQSDICFPIAEINDFYCGNFEYCSADGAPFTFSKGIYRIPFLELTSVHVDFDHITNCPRGGINMHANGTQSNHYYLVAAADGWIRANSDNGCADLSCSNFVWMEHPNGEWTFYQGLSVGSFNDQLSYGDWVTAGTLLGEEGFQSSADSVKGIYFAVVVPVDTDKVAFNAQYGYPLEQWTDKVIPLFCNVSDNLLKYSANYTAISCNASCDAFVPFLDVTYDAGSFETFIDNESLSNSANMVFEAASAGVMQSGSSITLKPGFQAKNLSNFQARIGTCSGAGFDKLMQEKEENIVLPETFSVYPNPALTTAVVSFYVKEAVDVKIVMEDLNGRIIKVITDGNLVTGKHTTTLELQSLPKGMYILKKTVQGYIATQKLIVQ